jgi:elongator complex protein 2
VRVRENQRIILLARFFLLLCSSLTSILTSAISSSEAHQRRVPSSGGMKGKRLYTAASANRASHIADWALIDGTDELVYASHKNLVIASKVGSRHPPPPQVIVTPNGPLTVVKYAYSTDRGIPPRIFAASSDGYLHLYAKEAAPSSSWSLVKSWASTGSESQQKATTFPGKRSKAEGAVSVRALGVLRLAVPWAMGAQKQDDTVIVSASSDGQMKIWKVTRDGKVELSQTASLGKARAEIKTEVLPLDIAIAALPSSSNAPTNFLMAIAGTDGKVDLWLSEGDYQFKRLFSITGHSDWVRSLDFCRIQEARTPTLMLATGAQDGTVRLWRVERSSSSSAASATPSKDLDEFDRLAMQIEDDKEVETIATKAQTFVCDDARWDLSLDALLTGHEHWITGTRWAPLDGDRQPAAILSSSSDNSVILWVPSSGITEAISSTVLPRFPQSHKESGEAEQQDVWVSIQRFGELGNVGSSANGMYGAIWDPCMSSANKKQAALGHGYGGALQIWSRKQEDGRLDSWKAQSGLGGHFAPSTCVRWEPSGRYFITGGLDKTTRLHGCFREGQEESWHEMARPQSHGFEIASLAWLSRLAFASAGDEKIIRVLEAPTGFVKTIQSLSQLDNDLSEGRKDVLLASSLPTLDEFTKPGHFEDNIRKASQRSLEKDGRLTIAAISPLFNGVKDGDSPRLSFEQAERFLKWCYSIAWSVAIKEKKLLFEVDVLLVGSDRGEEMVENVKAAGGEVLVGNELSCLSDGSSGGDTLTQWEVPPDAAIHCTLLNHSQRPSHTTKASGSYLPQYKVIALGGTFDHLHVGHKILLSMAALCATSKIIVGVTDDSMLSQKKSAHLLENIDKRIERVSKFLENFRKPFYDLEREVVKLQDVAGPAGTEANIDALLFTDETVSGADFIDKERQKNGLNKLERLSIGVIGAQGETDLQEKDAGKLAAAKVGSTAIRQWLNSRVNTTPLDQVATLNGEERPVGASVPPLGLSNRSIYNDSQPVDAPSESGQPVGKAQKSIAPHLTRPAVEEELHNNSLWCEVSKLYGHSLELLSIDVDIANGLVASSCKAKSGQLAVVLIHDRNKTWDEVQELHGHSLDVTKVRFSRDGSLLASVSRDRTWRLFREKKEEKDLLQLIASQEAHARIIYDVAWSFTSTRFATASRDGTVKVWSIEKDDQVNLSSTLQLKEPVTAVTFTWNDCLAVGSEKGNIYIYESGLGESSNVFTLSCSLPAMHSEAVSELAWRPVDEDSKEDKLLASSSLDGTVRLCSFTSS